MQRTVRNINGYATRGVTLVELLITLVVMGIVLGLAAPSFRRMITENSVTAQANAFIVAINTARSEASRTGSSASIQATGTASGNEFGAGYSVVDASGAVIRTWPALTNHSTLNSIDDITSIQFNSLGGLAGGAPLTFDLCSSVVPGKRIYVWPIGRVQVHGPDDPDATKRPSC